MTTVLKNIIHFTGLVVGIPTNLPHGLNINGVPVLPQLGGADAHGFTFTANTVNLTAIRLASASGGTVNCYVEHWHTIEALLPPTQLAGLVPFFFSNDGGGSGGGGQAFQYTVTGLEPDPSEITITLPVAMPNNAYGVVAQCQGCINIVGFDIPVTSRTTTNFLAIATGNLQAGDIILFVITPLT